MVYLGFLNKKELFFSVHLTFKFIFKHFLKMCIHKLKMYIYLNKYLIILFLYNRHWCIILSNYHAKYNVSTYRLSLKIIYILITLLGWLLAAMCSHVLYKAWIITYIIISFICAQILNTCFHCKVMIFHTKKMCLHWRDCTRLTKWKLLSFFFVFARRHCI